MTESELIVRQATQLEEQRNEIAALKNQITRARLHIICIGGPLNDNKLCYSRPQLVTFSRIYDELNIA